MTEESFVCSLAQMETLIRKVLSLQTEGSEYLCPQSKGIDGKPKPLQISKGVTRRVVELLEIELRQIFWYIPSLLLLRNATIARQSEIDTAIFFYRRNRPLTIPPIYLQALFQENSDIVYSQRKDLLERQKKRVKLSAETEIVPSVIDKSQPQLVGLK